MQLHGDVAGGAYDLRKKRAAALGREEARRVLDRDEVYPESHQLLGALDVVRIGVDRRERVGHHRVDLHPRRVARAHRRFDIAVVVERVVDGQHGNAAPRERFGVERDDIVGEKLEGVQALAAGEPVARCGQAIAQEPDALPGIFVQIAHADVEDRAAEDVDVRVPYAVDCAQDGRHHRCGHPRRPQALVRIAQRDVDEIESAVGWLRAGHVHV
jgi:hypothetical protein